LRNPDQWRAVSQLIDSDTIAAIATAAGRGGIGVIRISGPKASEIALSATRLKELKPASALFSEFISSENQVIDHGYLLYFAAPASFTGEDVVEIQAHGSPVLLDLILKRVIELGARQARPGEFSERAFLNNRIDLTQAEAIADLINASTEAAARSAIRSLQGEFSDKVNTLVEQLVALRAYIEAALDFPEEEIDFLEEKNIAGKVSGLLQVCREIFESACKGMVLSEGMRLAIIGKPNAGKSSLLNFLTGQETAIVTDIEGTTRDVISQTVSIDGIPFHLMDTAGLRDTTDTVEVEGIKRARKAMEQADLILQVIDSSKETTAEWPESFPAPDGIPVVLVHNKADISKQKVGRNGDSVTISIKKQQGTSDLLDILKEKAGLQQQDHNIFSARRRHLACLETAREHLEKSLEQISSGQPELVAEDLRLAQQSLETITGRFTPDDLLDKIFRDFCIGK
jgi:tRNA modification GTPase